MYQALYRKYRPKTFGDIAGQEHITETLRRQIISGRLTHAYLFVGTRGTGKTTCAKILSRAVNCLSPEDGEPCNKCLSCTGIEDGSILDVLELDAASNNGVDNVRALRDEAFYSPASVIKRVYIVDEVHMLTTAAFNALLKILEEPPEHLLFILATTELHKVPATILSRCQRFSFKRLSPDAIAARLALIASSEGFTLTADAADRLSKLADGSMRDGISLLDQCASDTVVDISRVLDTIGLAGRQDILRLAAAIAERDLSAALDILEKLYDDGKDMASLLNELAGLSRDILVFKLSPDSGLLSAGYDSAGLSALSKKLTPERIFDHLAVIKEAIFGLSRDGCSRLAAEMCLIRLCDERLSDNKSALLSRISELEKSIRSGARHIDPVVIEPPPEPMIAEAVEEPEKPVVAAIPDSDMKTHIPAQAPVQTPVQDAGDDVWASVLALFRKNVPVYALLSDKSKVRASLKAGTLVITAKDKFTSGTIESHQLDAIREAVSEVLGKNTNVRVETGFHDTNEGIQDKLDSLSVFGNVEFDQ